MEFFKKNKLISALAVIAICALAYFAYSSLGSSTPAVSSDAASPASQQLLVTLANLHTIQLNGSIFSNPTFVSLTDFGVIIAPEAVGRGNPFAPATGASSNSQTILAPAALQ